MSLSSSVWQKKREVYTNTPPRCAHHCRHRHHHHHLSLAFCSPPGVSKREWLPCSFPSCLTIFLPLMNISNTLLIRIYFYWIWSLINCLGNFVWGKVLVLVLGILKCALTLMKRIASTTKWTITWHTHIYSILRHRWRGCECDTH